ncbi:MAG: pentapeptide repeat-containing protein [Anaerolineae bacterium]|nr:pentapeptide repeat-containing protein [Anaerolineae bacterium]
MSEKLFRKYRSGIRRLIALLGKDHPRIPEVLVLQHRLIQNMSDVATLGTTAALELSRARILQSCNRLSQSLVNKSFFALCGLSAEKARKGTAGLVANGQTQPVMDAYFEAMSALLQHEELRSERASTQSRDDARERTLAILEELDGIQKGHIVQFLYESGLITEGPGVLFLSGADLSEVNLEDAVLIEAHLAGTDLRSAHLDAAHLEWARLGEACLEQASLHGTFLVAAHLAGAQLTAADLHGAHLLGANLSGADLSNAHLEEAQMQWASFLTANLSGAHLTGANLVGCELQSANMAGADLCSANLEDAHLAWVRLRGARYNDQTCWPENFDAVGAGAIKVEV